MAFQVKQGEKSSEIIEGLRGGTVRLGEVIVHRAEGGVPQAGVSESSVGVESARTTRIITSDEKPQGAATTERREEVPAIERHGTTIMTEFEEGTRKALEDEDYVIEGEIRAVPEGRKKKKEEEWGPY